MRALVRDAVTRLRRRVRDMMGRHLLKLAKPRAAGPGTSATIAGTGTARKSGIARAGLVGTAYLFGAATGLAAALPLAALAFTPERVPHPAPRAIDAPAVTQSPLVNRAPKGPRLDIIVPATTVPSAPSAAPTPDLARDAPPLAPKPAIDIKAPGTSPTPAGTAPAAMPRGCLSALGGLRPNIPTENLTVCLADISTIE
ncbi:hypothetical protein LGR54_18620 [Ancylobacter sp. Lp-2]|uniref:hypothetical protein n=1 Tax=Ancylobacter sp. Lp-2 TaxID=2881339 RepID=UPI001E58AC40|nr:hypothetical protein [Ancylobacter sp. Lp-2]MCB4770626.1 hypothetical protein [Ancylobacter sp. Lp-2]